MVFDVGPVWQVPSCWEHHTGSLLATRNLFCPCGLAFRVVHPRRAGAIVVLSDGVDTAGGLSSRPSKTIKAHREAAFGKSTHEQDFELAAVPGAKWCTRSGYPADRESVAILTAPCAVPSYSLPSRSPRSCGLPRCCGRRRQPLASQTAGDPVRHMRQRSCTLPDRTSVISGPSDPSIAPARSCQFVRAASDSTPADSSACWHGLASPESGVRHRRARPGSCGRAGCVSR